MTDTQWPRFEVFQQERAGEPHRNVGSVHAPDPEMALLHARDVFVRRPNCLSLWVVPADAILARTAQELEEDKSGWHELGETAGQVEPESYYVFQKQSQKPSDTFVTCVGTVKAQIPAQALRRALKTFTGSTPWVWWVFPARAVTRSDPDDVESMFEPARDKHYKYPSYYHTVSEMRQVRQQAQSQPR